MIEEVSAWRRDIWTKEILDYYCDMIRQVAENRARLIPYADLEDVMIQASGEWRKIQEIEEILDSPTLTGEGVKLNVDRIRQHWAKIIEMIKADTERFVSKGMPRPGPKFQPMFLLRQAEVRMAGKRVVRCVPVGGARVDDLRRFLDDRMTVGELQKTILDRGEIPEPGLKVIDDGTGHLDFSKPLPAPLTASVPSPSTADAVFQSPNTAPAVSEPGGSFTGLNLERIDEDVSEKPSEDDVSFQALPGISVELREL